jgi:hypothetical protein
MVYKHTAPPEQRPQDNVIMTVGQGPPSIKMERQPNKKALPDSTGNAFIDRFQVTLTKAL